MKSKQVAVINYGMGNIASVINALNLLGVNSFESSRCKELKNADAYILPGVGAFPRAIENLTKMNLVKTLNEQVLENKKPFLGICLGMQLLAKFSEEFDGAEGLGWINGEVVSIRCDELHRIPHVGWNSVDKTKEDQIFEGINGDAHFYFDHSYHFVCHEKDVILATCMYSHEIVSVLRKSNIIATQFHPEKSQRFGLKLLRNYINYVEMLE